MIIPKNISAIIDNHSSGFVELYIDDSYPVSGVLYVIIIEIVARIITNTVQSLVKNIKEFLFSIIIQAHFLIHLLLVSLSLNNSPLLVSSFIKYSDKLYNYLNS